MDTCTNTRHGVISPLKGGIAMIGSIHSDQRCPVCGGIFRDNGKDALECALHPEHKATKMKVMFGKVTRRFNDYKTALIFLSHLRVERHQGTFDYRKYKLASPLRFSFLSEQFLSLKQKTCKQSTVRKYRQYHMICSSYFGDTLIGNIGHRELQLFIHSLDYASYRVKCILDYMMELLNWCNDNGDLPKIPKRPAWKWQWDTKPIVDKKTQRKILYDIYDHEWERAPRACVGIELLMTYPKIRPGELRKVKEKHITNGVLIIPDAKEGGMKMIELLPEHVELIKQMPRGFGEHYFLRHNNGQRFGKDYLYTVWRRACARLGVHGVDLYRGTKHSTITDWSRKYPLAVIKRAANVSKSIERYIHLGDDDVQKLYQEAMPLANRQRTNGPTRTKGVRIRNRRKANSG